MYHGPLGPRGQAAQDRMTARLSRCNCESSHCDNHGWVHNDPCSNPADSRFLIDYVGTMCTACISTMCENGGSCFVQLIPQED